MTAWPVVKREKHTRNAETARYETEIDRVSTTFYEQNEQIPLKSGRFVHSFTQMQEPLAGSIHSSAAAATKEHKT